MPRFLLRPSAIGAVAGGAVLLMAPAFVFKVVTSEEWEIGLLRYVGLVTVCAGLLWESTRLHAGKTLRPARRRAAAAWILLGIYSLSRTGLLLVVGFSLLAAATLEIAFERAIAYSEAVRRRIDPPSPPSSSSL